MIERICPACQHGNPLNDRYCGKCGVPLERQLPARRDAAPMVVAGHQLPVTWQQLGRTVALSVAALAAEAGMSWLRRKIEAGPAALPTSLARRSSAAPPADTSTKSPVGSVITIVSQRVIEVWESADGKKQISERHFWRRTEE